MQQEHLVQRDSPARLEAQEPRVEQELPVLLDHLEVKVFLEDLAQPESLDPTGFPGGARSYWCNWCPGSHWTRWSRRTWW
jgi:hypothetical protein